MFETINTEDNTLSITIENILGATVKTQTVSINSNVELDIKNLPTGTYFVKATHGFNTLKTSLVIIQ